MGGKYVSWDTESNEPRRPAGDNSQFLRLRPGNKYKVRLVGKFYRYWQHWEPVICRSPGQDATTGQVIDPLMQMGKMPRERFAVWVLNREDGNRLQVMDFPPIVFDQFKEWRANFNEEPGGRGGPDWSIKIQAGPGGDNKKQKYVIMALDRAPLTEEEIGRIKEMGDIAAKLAEFRKDNTPEEIRAMLEEAKKKASGGGSSQQQPQQQQQQQQPAKVAAQPAAPAPAAPAAPAKGGDGLDF